MRLRPSRSSARLARVRERSLLVFAVVALFAGLAVWTAMSRSARDGDDRRAYVESMRPPPPLGVDLHAADPRGTAAADAARRAGLGDGPIRLFATRGADPIVGVGVQARDAIAAWTALRDVAAETHLWPVILGDGFELARHADATAHTSVSVASTLHRAETLDLDAWLAAQPAPDPGTPVAVASSRERYESILDPVLDMPVLDIAIALLPIARGADAPAWLAFGNWPGCPEPAVHVAMLRRLEDDAHVELVAITGDRIELRVPSPPTDPASRDRIAALLARWDATAFARDRATIATWSATLVTSHSWSFSFPRPH
jgi:hypothetical protein